MELHVIVVDHQKDLLSSSLMAEKKVAIIGEVNPSLFYLASSLVQSPVSKAPIPIQEQWQRHDLKVGGGRKLYSCSSQY